MWRKGEINMRRFTLTALFLAVVMLFSAGLYNAAYGSPQDKLEEIEKTKTDISELQKHVKELEVDIKERETRLVTLTSGLEETEKQLKLTEQELSASEARLADKNKEFGGRLRSAYMKGGLSYVQILLEADNFGDLIVRLAYLTRILNKDAEIMLAVREEYDTLTVRKAEMEAQRKSIEDMKYQLDAEKQNLVAQRKTQDALLKKAKDKLAADLADITPQADKRPAYAIVIDNISKARPQHGLSQASIMYEYEVEGRITRYLALFANLPKKVGPIRSAREHSIMLAMENGAHYIYASAGYDVLEYIKKWNVDGTNVISSRSSSFFRDSSRKAPHNLYVNLATLNLASAGPVTIRPAYLSKKGTPAQSFFVEYSDNHRIRYDYDQRKGAYKRHINGKVHKDASGVTIFARNVVVQYVPHKSDWRGRPTPQVVGSGAIDFYCQGQQYRGTWSKASKEAPTRFFYEDGQEIERIYGQTWIQLVRPN
jgi:peptidoglycan hydrolase CwlO-like protein